MEECELCGENIDGVYVVNVEGVELRVCASCAKGKRVIYTENNTKKIDRSNKAYKPVSRKKEEELELVENYGERIRKARENMGLPLKVFAEMINEKESLLKLVEKEQTLPTIPLTKKLEKNLKIKLEQSGEMQIDKSGQKKSGSATLGEFA